MALLVPPVHASVFSNGNAVSPSSPFPTGTLMASIIGGTTATPTFRGDHSEWIRSEQGTTYCAGCPDFADQFASSGPQGTTAQTFTNRSLSAQDGTAGNVLAYLTTSVPEPSALALLGGGLTMVAILLRRLRFGR